MFSRAMNSDLNGAAIIVKNSIIIVRKYTIVAADCRSGSIKSHECIIGVVIDRSTPQISVAKSICRKRLFVKIFFR